MSRLAPLALVTVLGLGLSACGGADAGSASDTPSGTAPTSATDEPSSSTPGEDESDAGEGETDGPEQAEQSEQSDQPEQPNSVSTESQPATEDAGATGSPGDPGSSSDGSDQPGPSPSRSPAPADEQPPASGDPAPEATGDDRVFPGGTRLRAYRDDPTYPWRVNVLDVEDELVPAMQRVAPALTRMKLEQVIATCESLVVGVSGRQLVAQTRKRFSDPADIGTKQARRLIDLSGQHGCPQ